MKEVLGAFCWMALSATLLAAQSAPALRMQGESCQAESDRAARQIIADWKEGYNSGDARRVANLYAEDATYLTQHFESGIVQGRANIQAYVQRGVDAHYRVDSIDVLHVGCESGLLYAITRYESTNAGQKAFGVNLVVARKSTAGWKIVAHEAAVPEPNAIRQSDLDALH